MFSLPCSFTRLVVMLRQSSVCEWWKVGVGRCGAVGGAGCGEMRIGLFGVGMSSRSRKIAAFEPSGVCP